MCSHLLCPNQLLRYQGRDFHEELSANIPGKAMATVGIKTNFLCIEYSMTCKVLGRVLVHTAMYSFTKISRYYRDALVAQETSAMVEKQAEEISRRATSPGGMALSIALYHCCLEWFDFQDRLAFLYNLAAFSNQANHTPAHFRLDLIKDFHSFNESDNLANVNNIPNIDERWQCWRR
jgi:hypothetical protein